MVNYSNGKIYCIKSKQTPLMYIGSTCDILSKRMGSHKARYKKDKSETHTVNKILKYSDAWIELIEDYPCESKRELLDREGHYQKNIPCCNTQIQGRTMKQYRIDNADKLKQQSKDYREKNKDKLKDKHKEWYKGEGAKKYYEKKKQELKEPKICECGMTYGWNNRARHLKTKRHMNRMNVVEEDRHKINGNWDETRYIKIKCKCDDVVSWGCYTRHLKRKHNNNT